MPLSALTPAPVRMKTTSVGAMESTGQVYAACYSGSLVGKRVVPPCDDSSAPLAEARNVPEIFGNPPGFSSQRRHSARPRMPDRGRDTSCRVPPARTRTSAH